MIPERWLDWILDVLTLVMLLCVVVTLGLLVGMLVQAIL